MPNFRKHLFTVRFDSIVGVNDPAVALFAHGTFLAFQSTISVYDFIHVALKASIMYTWKEA